MAKRNVLEPFTDEIKLLCKNGVDIKYLMDKYNVSYNTVYSFLRVRKIPYRRKTIFEKLSPHKDKIISLYKEGKSSSDLSLMYKCSGRTILDFLKENGVKTRTAKEGSNLKKVSRLDDHKDDILKLYNEGYSGKYIGDLFDTSSSSVFCVIRKYGGTVRSRYPKDSIMNSLDISIVKKMYDSGKTQKDIAIALGVSCSTITKFFKLNNIPVRDFSKSKEMVLFPYKDEIIRLHKSGKSRAFISDLFGVSRCAISNFLKRHNVEKCNKSGKISSLKDNVEYIEKLVKSRRYSLIDLASMFSVATSTFTKFIKDKGIWENTYSNYGQSEILFLDNKDEILKMYYEGIGLKEIALKFNIIESTLNSVFRRNNVKRRGQKRKTVLDDYKEDIIKMINDDIPRKEISDICKISESTLYKFLKRNNIPFKSPYNSKLMNNKTWIINSYNKGMKISEISRILDIPYNNLNYFIKRKIIN